MGILPELPVVGVGKKERRGEEDRAIKKGDKSPKRLLITLAKIRAEEFMTCLSETMQDNTAKTIIGIPFLKFWIRSALISPLIIMIKFVSGPLPGLSSAWLPSQASDSSFTSVLLLIPAANPSLSIANLSSLVTNPLFLTANSLSTINDPLFSKSPLRPDLVSNLFLVPAITNPSSLIFLPTPDLTPVLFPVIALASPLIPNLAPSIAVGAKVGAGTKGIKNGDGPQISCPYWV